MTDTELELKNLNENATLLLSKYDGVFSKLSEESQKILLAFAQKSEEGLTAISTLLESGNVAQAENALKLGGNTLEQMNNICCSFVPNECRVENTDWHSLYLNPHENYNQMIDYISFEDGKIKILKAGVYKIDGNVMTHNDSIDAERNVCLYKNNNVALSQARQHYSNQWLSVPYSGISRFEVGDIIEVKSQQNINNNSYQTHSGTWSQGNITYMGGL